jgi:S1-C subfamily serine protease
MNLKLVVPAVAALAIVASLPASACDQNKTSATSSTAAAHSCSGMSRTMAWSGAWLQRTPSGGLTVVAIAKDSPAAHSGLQKGDVVLAVNGRDLSASSGHMCADGSACVIGSSFAYTVQRGSKTRTVKVKLEKMPQEATMRFADLEPTYEPTLAAVVITTVD